MTWSQQHRTSYAQVPCRTSSISATLAKQSTIFKATAAFDKAAFFAARVLYVLYFSASISFTPSRQVTGVSLDAKYYCPPWHLPDLVVGSEGIAESIERRTTPPSQTGKPSSLNTTSPTSLICAPQPSTLSRPKNQMPKSAPQRHFLRPTTRRPSR